MWEYRWGARQPSINVISQLGGVLPQYDTNSNNSSSAVVCRVILYPNPLRVCTYMYICGNKCCVLIYISLLLTPKNKNKKKHVRWIYLASSLARSTVSIPFAQLGVCLGDLFLGYRRMYACIKQKTAGTFHLSRGTAVNLNRAKKN